MAFDEYMSNADALLAKLQALQDASKLSAGTSAGAGGLSVAELHRALREYERGTR